MAEELVSIGSFSFLSGLSVTTLRHYDEVGLLKPAAVDQRTNYRRYRRDQLERARAIAALRRVELPLEDIRLVLDGKGPAREDALLRHRAHLTDRGAELDRMVDLVDDILERGIMGNTAVADVRLVALNLGARSAEELAVATKFWEALFGSEFEDWGQGSSQMRVGSGDEFFLFNLRVREPDEPQYGHGAAFGLGVRDVDEFHRRALEAGATEHFAPVDVEGMPRHSRFEDPIGNRVVLWQC